MVSSLMLTKDDTPTSLDKIATFEKETEVIYNFLQKQKHFYRVKLVQETEVKDSDGYALPFN